MAGKNGHRIVRGVSAGINDYDAVVRQLREIRQVHTGAYRYLSKRVDHYLLVLVPILKITLAQLLV